MQHDIQNIQIRNRSVSKKLFLLSTKGIHVLNWSLLKIIEERCIN